MNQVIRKILPYHSQFQLAYRFIRFKVLSQNCAVYEIMWKNIVQSDRPQMTIWRIRNACWIRTATNTVRVCNTFCLSTATTVVRRSLNVALCVHHMPCYILHSEEPHKQFWWTLCKKTVALRTLFTGHARMWLWQIWLDIAVILPSF
jgi:hypothetical protein